MTQFKSFEVKIVGPVALIQPRETEIVKRNLINDLADDLIEYVQQAKPTKVVLTLKRVTRYSSEAIGGLIRVERRVRAEGGRVKLCMNQELRELFKVTRLDGTLFEIYESESEAVASFFEKGRDLFSGS
jgi:anti-sigma B factor antagonist